MLINSQPLYQLSYRGRRSSVYTIGHPISKATGELISKHGRPALAARSEFMAGESPVEEVKTNRSTPHGTV